MDREVPFLQTQQKSLLLNSCPSARKSKYYHKNYSLCYNDLSDHYKIVLSLYFKNL